MKQEEIEIEIRKLKHGEHFVVPESDYGKAEIWRIHDALLLFEIPMCGGEPSFNDSFSPQNIKDILNVLGGWT